MTFATGLFYHQKIGPSLSRVSVDLLPLMDLFRNKEIEINIDVNELENLFEASKVSQVTAATAI